MQIIEKDILTVERGIIFQQVNCQGVMGSGLAKAIRDKWPIVYEEYKIVVNAHCEWIPNLLGKHNLTQVGEKLFVCSIFGQLNYGHDGKRYTDYCALNRAFKNLIFDKNKGDMFFPYRFGSDRGGGDFNLINGIIEHYFPEAIFCKLPKT